MAFKRYLSESGILHKLSKEELFIQKLLPDSRKRQVFPAIRNNSVNFYYKGSLLFKYDGDFSTHRKFIPMPDDRDYYTQEQIRTIRIAPDYLKDYEEIKKACNIYSGVESEGVANIYSLYSYLNADSSVIVLDIEVVFETNENEDKDNQKTRTDRPDLVLYNIDKKELLFVEAKHFSNSEIWSSPGNKPKVVEQIRRYNDQLASRNEEILSSYKKYVDNINELFGLLLPPPEICRTKAGLFIFGFDRDQQNGRLNKLLNDDGSLDGIYNYQIGNPKNTDAEKIWNIITNSI